MQFILYNSPSCVCRKQPSLSLSLLHPVIRGQLCKRPHRYDMYTHFMQLQLSAYMTKPVPVAISNIQLEKKQTLSVQFRQLKSGSNMSKNNGLLTINGNIVSILHEAQSHLGH